MTVRFGQVIPRFLLEGAGTSDGGKVETTVIKLDSGKEISSADVQALLDKAATDDAVGGTKVSVIVDGKPVEKTIRQLRNEGMMQEDYTRKRQADNAALEAERAKLAEDKAGLEKLKAGLLTDMNATRTTDAEGIAKVLRDKLFPGDPDPLSSPEAADTYVRTKLREDFEGGTAAVVELLMRAKDANKKELAGLDKKIDDKFAELGAEKKKEDEARLEERLRDTVEKDRAAARAAVPAYTPDTVHGKLLIQTSELLAMDKNPSDILDGKAGYDLRLPEIAKYVDAYLRTHYGTEAEVQKKARELAQETAAGRIPSGGLPAPPSDELQKLIDMEPGTKTKADVLRAAELHKEQYGG